MMMMRFWIWEMPTSSCSALPSFNGCSRLCFSTVHVALYMFEIVCLSVCHVKIDKKASA